MLALPAMRIETRRVIRLSLTTSLALAAGYALALQAPFLAPIFGFMLTAAPKPPPGVKGLLGLVVAVTAMLGIGLLLIPVLREYPATGLMIVLLGLFAASYITLNLGKAPVGALLTMGLTMVTMIGQLSFAVAVTLVQELAISVAIAIVCQWVVYPWFPEDASTVPADETPAPSQSSWMAARSTLIVFPGFLLGLTNPTFYAPIIMKSVALSQQATDADLRDAGSELLGSTFVAGVLAILLWFGLKLAPNLWMFFWWMFAFSFYIVAKLYGVVRTRYPASFWQSVMITLIVLIGPAVADSANGKDPYEGFIVRMGLYIGLAAYAWLATLFLDWLRERLESRAAASKAGLA